MTKIKINKLNKIFWYYPSILTPSRTSWVLTPFRNIIDLIRHYNLETTNCCISINRPGAVEMFQFTQKYRHFNFLLIKSDVMKIENNQIVEDKINDDLVIIWNKKSIKKVKSGLVPYCTQEYLIDKFVKPYLSDRPIKITWKGKDFDFC